MWIHEIKQSRSYGGSLLFSAALFLAFIPIVLLADEVSVTNNISAEANTGGNSASAGQVSEGTSESYVRIYTEVNGEVVTNIDERVKDDELIIETEVKRPDEGVEVYSHVQAHAEGGTQEEATNESEQPEEADMDHIDITVEEDTQKPMSLRTWAANIISYVFGFFR